MPRITNFADVYWQVDGDVDHVFSSARLIYVSVEDPLYTRYLTLGGTLIPIADAASLASVVQTLVVPLILANGLQVTSNSNPQINGTYALNATTLNQIGAVARDAASGLGLPENADTFTYPDINGVPHSFTSDSIIDLYKALRNYVSACNTAAQKIVLGQVATMPTNTAALP